jgi:uncharacterized protein (DUF433 family)
MTPNIHLTPREAAFVLDENLKSITRVLDGQSTRRRLVERRGVAVRLLTEFDLLFFLALRGCSADLTPAGRSHLLHAFHGSEPLKRRSVPFGSLSIDLTRYKTDLRARIQRYEKLRKSVEFADGKADPFIKGTTIEVHRIAALLDGGATVDDVRWAYPSLTAEQIENARAYAVANPKHGRPYPKESLKQIMKHGLRDMKWALEEAGSHE